MKLTLLSVLSAIVGVSGLVPSVPQSRIVGGYEVSPKFRYPWMIVSTRQQRQWCGGILLNNNYVYTAAHCSQDPASYYAVLYHRHNVFLSEKEEQGQRVNVSSVVVHPQYNSFAIKNDVAVWKLAKPIVGDVGNIELDSGSYSDSAGMQASAIGWGLTAKDGPFSPILLQVDIPIVSYEECNKVWSQRGKPISKDFYVCAAGEGGKDVCQGDSGGPLFVEKNGKAIIIGTTSSGLPCANKGVPSIWARSASYKQWILDQVKI